MTNMYFILHLKGIPCKGDKMGPLQRGTNRRHSITVSHSLLGHNKHQLGYRHDYYNSILCCSGEAFGTLGARIALLLPRKMYCNLMNTKLTKKDEHSF